MAKSLAKISGVLIIVFSLMGFFSDSLVGNSGYFLANTGLNVINLIFGILLVGFTSTEMTASAWLRVLGVLYFAFGVIGFFLFSGNTANVLGFMSFNSADNWLYVILGFVLFLASYTEERPIIVARSSHIHHHVHQ